MASIKRLIVREKNKQQEKEAKITLRKHLSADACPVCCHDRDTSLSRRRGRLFQ